ncbi:whey acidic protein-like, partial [Mytilus trossulus]|uniref:whey acidic protein-like n=1 Tax=Mytilus trossulus TaxID=6551 RepID=UPI00300499D1
SMCCPKECGKECTVKRKYGLCPTFTDKPLSYCMVAFVISNCGGNDADCSDQICCGVTCGIGCTEPVKPNPPKPRQGVCPPIPKGGDPNFCNLVDVKYDCDTDSDCTEKNKKCCGTPCGGRACTNPIKGDRTGCPSCKIQPSLGCPACFQYLQLCNSDRECGR